MEAEADALLQDVLDGLNAGGFAAEVWDRNWRLFGVTDDYKIIIAAGQEAPDIGVGLHFMEPRMEKVREAWPAGPTGDSMIRWFRDWGGAMAGSGGGLGAMRDAVGDHLKPIVDEMVETPMPAVLTGSVVIRFGSSTIENDVLMMPVRGDDGVHAGAVAIVKPAVGSAVLGMLALGDARLFERMLGLVVPAQRPGAIMFGDLEGSTSLARRLPSSVFFKLIRRLSRAMDEIVVDAGGIVGKHAGDGVTAFFLSEGRGSDSSAARSCIASARAAQKTAAEVAERTDLDPSDVSIRFGLHWGSGLYVGRLLTSGRLEVTALGDEVNEGARIEASAGGGMRLASKQLLEKLDAEDSEALGFDSSALSYTPLAELETAPGKAQRDAANISVCAV